MLYELLDRRLVLRADNSNESSSSPSASLEKVDYGKAQVRYIAFKTGEQVLVRRPNSKQDIVGAYLKDPTDIKISQTPGTELYRDELELQLLRIATSTVTSGILS